MLVRLTDGARHDFEDIWEYSASRWGEQQADSYLQALEHGVIGLAENPVIGAPCEHIRSGYRRYHAGRHMIFYRLTEEFVEIIRVLHESMDPFRHI